MRVTRYQGAIIREHQILLIQHTEHATQQSYWVIPGGGIEPGEAEEACVEREMLEETSLRVKVETLLLHDHSEPGDVYKQRKTYLCSIVTGEARPGFEPEPDAAAAYGISAVAWFDLRQPQSWPELLVRDQITYPLIKRIQAALGYPPAP